MHRYHVEIKNGTTREVLYYPLDPDRQIYDDESFNSRPHEEADVRLLPCVK